MRRDEQVRLIEQSAIIAIVRLDHSRELVQVARAIAEGGVRAIEFTMTTPNALQTITATAKELGDRILLGAGTVLDAETARAAILAGAEFVVAPTLNQKVIETCHRYDKAVIPGAYTPTEVLTAWEWGADLVKVFPADAGGPAYLRAISAPLPQIRLVAVGGVSLENAAQFVHAGARAVGVGSHLVDKKLVAEGRFEALTDRAKAFVAAVGADRPA